MRRLPHRFQIPTFIEAAALALGILSPLAVPTHASCPPSQIQLSQSSGVSDQSRASIDTSYAGPSFHSAAAFDLVTGTVALSMTPAQGEHVFVVAADQYEIVGLPDGAGVDVDLVLDFEGTLDTPGCPSAACSAEFRAIAFSEFFEQSKVVSISAASGSASSVDQVSAPAHMVAGVPQTMGIRFSIRVAPGGLYGGVWAGRLHFNGLPFGARIVSCRGYSDGVTPARPATWGRIKLLYR
jgi:hypothetical protein